VALEQMDVLFKSHTAAHDQFIRSEILTLMLADDAPKRNTPGHVARSVNDSKKASKGGNAASTEEWIERSDIGGSSSARA